MRRWLPILLLAACLAGCNRGPDDSFGDAPEPAPPIDPSELCNDPGNGQCDGFDYEVCVEGRWFRQDTCEPPTPLCDPDEGCTGCTPDQAFCVDREIWTCSPDGSSATLTELCDSGEECLLGQCYSACQIAEQTRSYLGCRFLAVPTANVLAESFAEDFAVVVANASPTDVAEVTVRQSGTLLQTATVPPNEIQALPLPLLTELQDSSASARVSNGAFEVTSSVPVAAYQFNPQHFQLSDGDNGQEYSFTNDASLLLPEHVLSGNYLVSTWPTWAFGSFPGKSIWNPGFVAIAATGDGTLVEIRTSANTQDGTPPALQVGENTVVSLDRGDVLQLFSEIPTPSTVTNTCAERGGEQGSNGVDSSCFDRVLGDLTGTTISADQPVAVFAGHVCTFMPFDRWACDHLEEMMFPTETWGQETVMTAPASPGLSGTVPAYYRVLSLVDSNRITFSPAVHDPVELASGEFVEFLSGTDFQVEGEGSFYATQTLLGEEALGTSAGDPAMGSGIPRGQWRSEYDILTPTTYTSNWVNLVGPSEAEVYLDSELVEDWEPIDGTDLRVARIRLASGAHRLESVSDVGFGITSYGYARYTSYLYPGGMNFLR